MSRDKLSRAELENKMLRMAERYEAVQRRQVDSINRLLGHEMDGKVDPGLPRYEHELMHLNEQLALKDIRVEMLEGTIRRIRQSVSDRPAMDPREADFLKRIKDMIEEVMPDERPGHVAEGYTTADIQPVEYVVENPRGLSYGGA